MIAGAALATAVQPANAARVAEQVSPVVKTNGNGTSDPNTPQAENTPVWTSKDGETALFLAAGGAITGDVTHGGQFPVLARRTADGWQARNAAPNPRSDVPYTAVNATPWQILPSEDRSRYVFSSAVAYAADQPAIRSPSLNGALLLGAADSVTWLSKPTSSAAAPAAGTFTDKPNLQPAGASGDLTTVYFTSKPRLTDEDVAVREAGSPNSALYRWRAGTLEPAGVLPDGSLDPGGSVAAGVPQTSIGDPVADTIGQSNSVSRDGDSILFVSPDPVSDAALSRAPQLYLARDGEPTRRLTDIDGDGVRQIAATTPFGNRDQSGTVPADERAGSFAIATPDHRFVVFATADALTAGAEDPSAPARKVYRWDARTGDLQYLPEISDDSLNGYGAVLRMSDDGSRILYAHDSEVRLWREGQPSRLVGSLGAQADARTALSGSTARFSADARTVVFDASDPVNDEPLHPAGTRQIYRFSEGSDELACVSCGTSANPASTSAAPLSNLRNRLVAAERRAMSDDGSIVVFATESALTDADANAVSDVYEWRDGTARLVTGGRSDGLASVYNDMSASGRDIFVSTADQLASTDRDSLYDIYDLRDGGGFPDKAPEAPCVADECQGAPARGPSTPTPGTTVVGPVTEGTKDSAPMERRVQVSRVKPRSNGLVMTVNAPAAGRLQIRGRRIVTATRVVKRAGKVSIKPRLSGSARRSLQRRGRLKVVVRVRFVPSRGTASSKTITVTLKRSAR